MNKKVPEITESVSPKKQHETDASNHYLLMAKKPDQVAAILGNVASG